MLILENPRKLEHTENLEKRIDRRDLKWGNELWTSEASREDKLDSLTVLSRATDTEPSVDKL